MDIEFCNKIEHYLMEFYSKSINLKHNEILDAIEEKNKMKQIERVLNFVFDSLEGYLSNSSRSKLLIEILQKIIDQTGVKIVDDLTIDTKSIFDRFKLIIKNRVCPDQYVCKIEIANRNIEIPSFEYWDRKNIDYYNSDTNNKIILIMESPHKDEFTQNIPNGPAFGKTGKNIASYFESVLNKEFFNVNISLSNGTYDLYLINAIQFQCSLGLPTEYFRDLIFTGLWFNGGEENFKNRLEKIKLNNNDIVINSCTNGEQIFSKIFGKGCRFDIKKFNSIFQQKISQKKFGTAENRLKCLVTEAIGSNPAFIYKEIKHPSSWHIFYKN